jgi:hypothetical protein
MAPAHAIRVYTSATYWGLPVTVVQLEGRGDYVAMAALGTAHEIALATIYEDLRTPATPWRLKHARGKHATLTAVAQRAADRREALDRRRVA